MDDKQERINMHESEKGEALMRGDWATYNYHQARIKELSKQV